MRGKEDERQREQMRVWRGKVAEAVWISLKRNSGADLGEGDNWGIGRWDRERAAERGEERDRDEGKRESKRIEESNRHSNYRSRNEGLMTKNGAKESKEQDEEEMQ